MQPDPGPVAQHWGLVAHPSPSWPHIPTAWHTETPALTATHEPEQQSAFELHSEHSSRQPPGGAQRDVPSLEGRH